MNNIKVGDFVKGWFKGSRIYGVVVQIKRDAVVVERYEPNGKYDSTTDSYSSFRNTNQLVGIRQKATIEKVYN